MKFLAGFLLLWAWVAGAAVKVTPGTNTLAYGDPVTPKGVGAGAVAVVSSNTTFTIANMALDSTNVIDVGSNLRTNGGAISMAFNRPAIDSSHVLWTAMTNGSTTNVTDASGIAGNGIIATNTNHSPWWKQNPVYAPWAGTNGLNFGNGETLTIGNNLLFERTQKWTVWAVIDTSLKPIGDSTGAAIIFTDYNTHGYEMWIESGGRVEVKLINTVGANEIGVRGGTDVTDGKQHVVVASYDGSSAASGVAIYVDGVAESLSILNNTLSATVVSAGPLLIGNQILVTNQYWFPGVISGFALDVTNWGAAYITQHSTNSTTFAPSNNCTALRLIMNDSGASTSVTDSSSNNFACTINGPAMWIAGPNSVPALMGDTALNFKQMQNTGISGAVKWSDNAAFNLLSNYTFSVWANAVAGDAGGMFDRYNGGTGGTILSTYTGPTEQFFVANAMRDFGIAPISGWVQHVVRFTAGGTLELFTNGVLAKALTAIPVPASATGNSMNIGESTALTKYMNGSLSMASISRTNRSNAYISQFSTRYPTAGIASLANPGTANTSGGGDLGVTSTVTNFAASFALPSTSTILYRIGAGASSGAATTAKLAASFVSLAAGNNQVTGVSGRFIDWDTKLVPSTDPLLIFTPFLTNVTVTYTQ